MAQEQADRTERSMLRTLPVRSCLAGATATQILKHIYIILYHYITNISSKYVNYLHGAILQVYIMLFAI